MLIIGFDDVVVEDDDLNLRRDFLGPKALLIIDLLFLNLDKNYNRKDQIFMIVLKITKI